MIVASDKLLKAKNKKLSNRYFRTVAGTTFIDRRSGYGLHCFFRMDADISTASDSVDLSCMVPQSERDRRICIANRSPINTFATHIQSHVIAASLIRKGIWHADC